MTYEHWALNRIGRRAPAGHEQFYYYCAGSFICGARRWQPKITALRRL